MGDWGSEELVVFNVIRNYNRMKKVGSQQKKDKGRILQMDNRRKQISIFLQEMTISMLWNNKGN